jgi:spore germination protein YaaH
MVVMILSLAIGFGVKKEIRQKIVGLGAHVQIMIYDYHNGASEAGPIAPLLWADEVLRFAASQVPPAKTFMGVHFYGYNWTGSHGESINWRQAMQTAERNEAEWQRDESGEAWFRYGPDDRHTVYVADAEGVQTRLQTLYQRHPDLAGISIWSLGGEDPGNWATIRESQ